eukprot:6186675-Pleurochrysis_carterae.AAC.1
MEDEGEWRREARRKGENNRGLKRRGGAMEGDLNRPVDDTPWPSPLLDAAECRFDHTRRPDSPPSLQG